MNRRRIESCGRVREKWKEGEVEEGRKKEKGGRKKKGVEGVVRLMEPNGGQRKGKRKKIVTISYGLNALRENLVLRSLEPRR